MLYKLSADFSKLANDHVNSATQKEVLINKKKLHKTNKQINKETLLLAQDIDKTNSNKNSFTI